MAYRRKPVEPTVFVVDDDKGVRDALKLLLESVDLNVETYATATDFLKAYDTSRPGCLILDVRLPKINGLDLQRELNARHIRLPVIIVTGYGDISMAVRVMKEGAIDFIEKPFNDHTLLECVQHSIARDAEIRKEQRGRSDICARLASLTSREREVMALVVKGSSNKNIADILCVSCRTVEIHRAHVMKKMRAKSMAELFRMAVICEDCEEYPDCINAVADKPTSGKLMPLL